ncbi:MAG: transposase [Candidatus Absconditabacterales bacterium]
MGQQRYYEGGVYFVTFNTFSRFPYFQHSSLCDLFIEELILAKQEKKFDLYAFCINYDHVHLLLGPDESIGNISQVVQFIKRHFSKNANIILGYTSDDLKTTNVADNGYCQLNKKYCQLNKKISCWKKEFLSMDIHDIPKFKRQKSFYDHIIRDYSDFYTHYRYTTDNYLKHGLSDNRQYTGSHYPHLIDTLEV